ncbi:unnamed protein product [Bursaphelenchus okinawaensis]|uniref:SGNH domain-containing protein n=1 Tax=Bursaphelenchus okinawaensis TaxID=465554 RepID=A0A811L052_9BILA|nr:unnamed protein product [Bursaphelenchus okinawaensis]CAG9114335.1 unnamed protein product [Bursaphelenchus okinawaensis]
MRHVYKTATLFYIPTAIPFYRDWDKEIHPSMFYDAIENIRKMLPIDILIIKNSYVQLLKKPRYIQHFMLDEMQKFYDNVTSKAKHIVMSYSDYHRSVHFEKFNRDVQHNNTRNPYCDYKKAKANVQKLDKIIDKIKCKNCIKVNFNHATCDYVINKCINALPNGIALFRDIFHTTFFGNLLHAEFLEDELKLHNIL